MVALLENQLANYGYDSITKVKISDVFSRITCDDFELPKRAGLGEFEFFTSRMDFGDRLRTIDAHILANLAIADIATWKKHAAGVTKRHPSPAALA